MAWGKGNLFTERLNDTALIIYDDGRLEVSTAVEAVQRNDSGEILLDEAGQPIIKAGIQDVMLGPQGDEPDKWHDCNIIIDIGDRILIVQSHDRRESVITEALQQLGYIPENAVAGEDYHVYQGDPGRSLALLIKTSGDNAVYTNVLDTDHVVYSARGMGGPTGLTPDTGSAPSPTMIFFEKK